MGKPSPNVPSSVRAYIIDQLFQRNHLLHNAFPVTERILTRFGVPCGVLFCLHGPRSVRYTAVYDLSREQIFFYDAQGQREQSERLPLVLAGNSPSAR
jgi:hypothetical protein